MFPRHLPPGRHHLAQLGRRKTAANGGEPVVADERPAKERPGAEPEAEVREPAAFDVGVQHPVRGEPFRVGEQSAELFAGEVVQHMVGDDDVEPAPFCDEIGTERPPKRQSGQWGQARRVGVRAGIRVNGRDAQAQAVPGGPAGQRPRHVAAAAADIEQGALPSARQQWPDIAAVHPAPPRHHGVHKPEVRVGAGEFVGVAVGVVHELDGVTRAPAQRRNAQRRDAQEGTTPRRSARRREMHRRDAHFRYPAVTVISPDSTVSPGPNAIAQTRSPSSVAGESRMALSTNRIVALLMLP